MTDEQILKQAIEKAVRGGYLSHWEKKENRDIHIEGMLDPYEGEDIFTIIFSHDFAKAFFPDTSYGYGYCKKCNEKLGETDAGGCECFECEKINPESIESWQYHLRQMVLEPEPLKYLKKFL